LCTAANVCKQVSLANAGESCGTVNGTLVACAANGRCQNMGGTSTCQAALEDGASCSAAVPNCEPPAQCLNGTCTIPDPGTCK
jgi:hypothetical protein